MAERYPKLSEKIHAERNWLRCKDDWLAHAVELEQSIDALKAELAKVTVERDAWKAAHERLANAHLADSIVEGIARDRLGKE